MGVYGVYRGVGPYSGGIPPPPPRHIVSKKGGQSLLQNMEIKFWKNFPENFGIYINPSDDSIVGPTPSLIKVGFFISLYIDPPF